MLNLAEFSGGRAGVLFSVKNNIYMEEKAVRRRSFARGRWRRRGLQSKNAGRIKRKEFLFDAQKCLPSAEGRHLQKQIVNGWLLSSDVGCAFIMLDGITQVYEVTKNVMLLPVIEEMLNKFSDIDYLQYNCQTHAVLSGTRGVLRFYKLTKNERWLRLAVRNFEIYLNYGTTINYANFNWFGKPSWTEPCAIIDSLIVSQELFRFTGERKYLEFMNRCYFNAFRFSQRPNGGAGCDTCLNEQNNRLVIYMYEAFFCCSMRIAEGLCDLALNGCIKRENVLYIPLLVGFENDLLSLQVEECEDKIILHLYVKNECSAIKIYLPEYAEVQSDKNYKISEGFVCLENCKGQYDILFSLKDHISISNTFTER